MTGPWRIVAGREIRVRVTDRAFLLSTLAMTVLLIAFLLIQSLLSGRTSTYDVVTVAPPATEMAKTVADLAPSLDDKVRVNVRTASGDAEAEREVEKGDADAWLVPVADGFRLVAREEVASSLEAVTRDAVRYEVLRRNAASAGTSLESLSAGTTVTTGVLHGDVKERQLGMGLAFVFVVTAASVAQAEAWAGGRCFGGRACY